SSPQELAKVDLAEVCQAAVELVEAELRKRRRKVVTSGHTSGQVQARGLELQQVLVNLILNAADAYAQSGREGPIQVVLCEDEQWAGFEVQDQAGGIPVEARDKIFDPFFTTKPPG